eukprot:IDg11702t1
MWASRAATVSKCGSPGTCSTHESGTVLCVAPTGNGLCRQMHTDIACLEYALQGKQLALVEVCTGALALVLSALVLFARRAVCALGQLAHGAAHMLLRLTRRRGFRSGYYLKRVVCTVPVRRALRAVSGRYRLSNAQRSDSALVEFK